MICEWGMSDRLGPISFGKKEGEVFLGRDIGHTQNYSEATAQVIDQEVREVVERNYRRARELLTSNMDVLHSMAAALLDYETLDADQIEMLMKGVKVPPKSSMPKPPKSGNEPTGSAPATNEGAMPSGTPVTA
jgi:cell division protease FtsH